jgi:hypothetical protein
VIGGNLTISSKIYESQLDIPGKEFTFTPAQPLSALVERGGFSVELSIAQELTIDLQSK